MHSTVYIETTVPFASAKSRAIHFAKHGFKFGATDEYQYERMADDFMYRPLRAEEHECNRSLPPLDRLRLNEVSLHFGVVDSLEALRTFFPRLPHEIKSRGGPAGFMEHKRTEVR